MKFDQENEGLILGKFFGYLFAYLIFSSFLYTLLLLTNKLPQTNPHFIVISITIIISSMGFLIKRVLK